MTQLSEHFSLEELTASTTAQRDDIDNTPTVEVINALAYTAMQLELVRAFLGHPMHIDSGYRSPALNKAVGGVANSAHLTGYAVDFTCPNFGTPLEIVEALKLSGLKWDQIIEEGTWVHISFAPAMRQDILLATFRDGKVTYSEGV